MIVDTPTFVQLDFKLIRNIVQSSKPHITSEFEVFEAANYWISYKPEKRSNYAKCLLPTVRLPLLSEPALKSLLCGTSYICKDNDCKTFIENILNENPNLLSELPKNIY